MYNSGTTQHSNIVDPEPAVANDTSACSDDVGLAVSITSILDAKFIRVQHKKMRAALVQQTRNIVERHRIATIGWYH
jgi:hypothetical protein